MAGIDPGGGQGLARCKICQMSGHYAESCPTLAVRKRNEEESCVADHSRTGKRCHLCGAQGHRGYHYRLAASDAQYTEAADGKVTWKGGAQQRPRDAPTPAPKPDTLTALAGRDPGAGRGGAGKGGGKGRGPLDEPRAFP